MKINEDKTKAMRVSMFNSPSPPNIKLDRADIECLDSFIYLVSQITSDNNHSVEIKRRLTLGSASFKALMPIWKQNWISVKLKLALVCSIIIPIAMDGCKTWTARVDDSRQLAAFETKLLRRTTGIICVDRVSNADLLKRLHYTTTILNRVRVHLFRWLCHVQHMCNDQLPKIAFEGRIHCSHPPKHWKENFSDWDLPGLLRMAQTREQYRQRIHSLVRTEALRRRPRPDGTSVKLSQILVWAKKGQLSLVFEPESTVYRLNGGVIISITDNYLKS